MSADRDTILFALDKSARHFDADGRLHVALSHISKANVCPYYGREIPNSEALGLKPDQIYHLLRDPEELRKAAPTANNLPLLDTHIIVSAAEPEQESVVGSTGTDAEFVDPYLNNSLVVWTDWAIEGIERRDQCQLSCAYRYEADMTPGHYNGVAHDGIMRSIVFNHVALVPEGRAGPDVVVGDSKEIASMPLVSRKALMARGALALALRPVLATDAKIDLDAALAGVTSKNFAAMKATVSKRIETASKGKLAADASLEPVKLALDAMEEEACEDEDIEDKDDKKAEDADPEDDDDKKDDDKPAKDKAKDEMDPKAGKAMDAAIAKAAKDARAGAIADMNAIAQARADVAPHIGEIAAMDSASAVYKLALDAAEVALDGTESLSALRTMVKLLPLPDATPKPRIALDAASTKGFNERFPSASRLGHA